MQHVQVSQNYFFPTDRITFNAIQSKLLRLIEEVRSDRFGRDAQIPLYVNDLLLYLNRLVYERLHPQKSRTEESLYQNVAAYIEEHLDEDLSLEKLGQMSITEAYQTFGFGDYSSFYRAFKKEYGISPKDFRDMQKDLLV